MNRGRGAPREGPTRQQIMQSILELQRQNEEIRMKAETDQAQLEKEREETRKKAEEDLQVLREEALGERERLRKDAEETHQRLEEALRQQEQLRKANEDMQSRLESARPGFRYPSRLNSDVSDTNPLVDAIMSEPIPQNFVIPKITPFTGNSDPELHLKAFQARMMISGGNDAVRCKMFVGTLTEIALKWFNTIPNSSISSFHDFKRLFLERFSANRAKPVEMADMFDIRQTAEETLKQFLNRFTNISMRLIDPNEGLLVKTFMKGLRASSFGESLYRYPPKSLTEIRQRAAVEIETEEAMRHKKLGDKKPVTHSRSERDMRPYRRERTPPKMKTDRRFVPYVAQRRTDCPQGQRIPNLKVPMAQVLEDVEVTRHLRYPDVAGRTLGNRLDAWCEFHQTRGHDTNYCYGLRYQLSVLANRGLLAKFMKSGADEKSPEIRMAPDIHETPILGDFNTIAGGFAGGGSTSSARKRYVRSVITTATMDKPRQAPDITFSNDDLKGVIPHEDDPIVVSVIMMGKNVHRVLIDQGSSADVMFWSTFVGLQIPIDQLKPFDGVLVGFSGDQVEVKGYVDLRTTFKDKEDAKTVFIRYIVVNTPSSYNLLLGRPSLNKLRAVISTIHLKMKFPSEEGKVLTLAVN